MKGIQPPDIVEAPHVSRYRALSADSFAVSLLTGST
jgi:hypothetical protein